MPDVRIMDPERRFRVALEETLADCDLLWVEKTADCRGADLVVVDVDGADLEREELAELAAGGPLLLLLSKQTAGFEELLGKDSVRGIRAPVDLFELGLRSRELLALRDDRGSRRVAPGVPAGRASRWLEFPFVPAPAAAVLKRASRLATPLWILGEPGSGKHRIAMAVAESMVPPRNLLALGLGQDLETLRKPKDRDVERCVLFVGDLQTFCLEEQERLAGWIVESGHRVIATALADPAAEVIEGGFSRRLYHLLSGLVVQIPPLREQPFVIPALVTELLRDIGSQLGAPDLRLSASALERLQGYHWPGNTAELEAVLIRSVSAAPGLYAEGRRLQADELLFSARQSEKTRSEHAAFGAVRGQESTEPASRRSGERQGFEAETDVEQVLARLAHDLRNPMTTIRTFASMAANSSAGPQNGDLAGLAREACDRLDEYVETLIEYSQLKDPQRRNIDLAEVVHHALVDRGDELQGRLRMEVGENWSVVFDLHQLCFVVDNILDAIIYELPEGAEVVLSRGEDNAMEFSVPEHSSAAAHLGNVLGSERKEPSWRILLARNVSRRNGGDIRIEQRGPRALLRWVLPGGEEVEEHGKQANSTDRR
ncbi:MAG: histidine kinase dimerization/phospho-acceptor domain-containing protein [Candidatus Binatia bacterium]